MPRGSDIPDSEHESSHSELNAVQQEIHGRVEGYRIEVYGVAEPLSGVLAYGRVIDMVLAEVRHGGQDIDAAIRYLCHPQANRPQVGRRSQLGNAHITDLGVVQVYGLHGLWQALERRIVVDPRFVGVERL